ncbi:hypothetical protein NDU88_005018 [Pleurodeles waltl]|uniref:Uncharacterized protein n=1 Tax=Pleurodeles waltl TaxID=8319 RepID=A0AAV7LN14_PLEWA|nr:hypothetical protein NDU88_005018 [Pleurodeles waltl]
MEGICGRVQSVGPDWKWGTSQHADSGEEEAPLQITKRREDADNEGGADKEEDVDNEGGAEKEGDADNSRVGDAEAEEACIQLSEQKEGNRRGKHSGEPWRSVAGNTTSEHISRLLGERRCEGAGHVPGEAWPYQVR